MDPWENFRKKHLPKFNPLKRSHYISKIQKILGDPLLWLRLTQPNEEISGLFGRLSKIDVAGDCFKIRLDYCDKSLQKVAGDEESQALYLKKLSETKKLTTDFDIRSALFPGSLPPEVLPAVNLHMSPQNDAVVTLESARAEPLLQGLVTDLYKCPGENEWDGYITSENAVYRFTTESCNCVFPICLGSYVEFCPCASTVTDHSLKMLQYPPSALPAKYAEDYLKQLEAMMKSSDSLIQRILQLPGPFASLVNDASLYINFQSSILAILYSISKDESILFPSVLSIYFHSQFIQELPQLLEGKYVSYHYCRDVQYFLFLVAMCVRYFPQLSYQLAPVIQGCARLASSFEREFADECSNICKAIVYACSEVRYKEDVVALAEIQETAEINTDLLLDPLLWVSCCFGQSVAHSLRKFLQRKSLLEGEEVVVARRRFENIIPSLTSCETKYSEKHLPEQLQIVKKVSCLGYLDSKCTIKTGIVIDLYQNGVGYIALALSQGHPYKGAQSQQIFKIDEGVTSVHAELWLHIGDVVKFQVSQGSPNVVHTIVRVTQYCPQALDEEFARHTLFSQQNAQNVEELFQDEAAIKGLFNAPHVYKDTEVCTALIAAVTDALSDSYSSTPSIKKRMLDLLKSSSFIHDLIDVEGAPQQVPKSVNILQEYLACFPNEVCSLKSTLEAMVTCLCQQHNLQELATFLSFLSTSSCILPPSIEIHMQPWQSIPTILTVEELKAGVITDEDLPMVRDHGSYCSINEYGRTYFILLRADCHGNLASAISKLREPASSTKKVPEFETIVCDALFTGLSNKSTGHHLVYRFNMESKPLPETVSRHSPLFMSGNLLCFSIAGRFENDIIWATINHVGSYVHIAKTTEGFIKSCEVCVQFCTESNIFSDEEAMQRLKGSKNAVALESPAYYRAYQPVLDVLKQTDLQNIHFIPDLLNPTNEPQASLELINDDILVTDLAGLYSEKAANVPKKMTIGELKELLDEGGEGFCLSEHQRKAVNQALSQALSLIHGPPGTGKSYMGMQLLRLFLSMRDCHSKKALLENKPALIMAYRNSALDHFIRMCLKFCPIDGTSIVRIGHVSKDTLKPLRLRERVMAALPRGPIVRFRNTLQQKFERVQKACSALEAVTKLVSLEDYLDSLTPVWLRSLILHSPLAYSHDVTGMVENADRCLALLQKKQLGREDRKKQHVIKTALEKAWKEWVKDVSSYPNPPNCESKKKNFTDKEEYERQIEEDCWDDDTEFETLTPFFYDDTDGPPVEISNVWELNRQERRRLIIASCRDRYVMAMEELKESIKQYNVTQELYERMYQGKALEILKQAKIVAMTTTGAAIHQQLLCQLEAPVVFVEEAAEILESNLLAVLTPHVKHMVLIGDHKQLKPTVSYNKLEKKKFNLSLFERLIRNDYPRTLLLRQNRMHRDLVPLFGYHYKHKGSKEILSSEKTEALEKPKCMGKNFFWWSYTDKYEMMCEHSKCNMHEVEMAVNLCCWLVCNKQPVTNVAVLTPYRGQLERIEGTLSDFAMKYKGMPSDLPLIGVYTVDEFQGHESEVVILSLVRSNSKGEIGFLSRFNRLVVGTSRQKCALYIVGNHTFLEKSSPLLWKEFIGKCKDRDSESIGTELPIVIGGNQKDVCQSPEELEERVKKLLEITANNAVVEPDSGSSLSTSESNVSTPASVRSLPQGTTSDHTLDDVQSHSVTTIPPVDNTSRTESPLRQQSSPAIFAAVHQSTQEVQDHHVDSSAPCWNFQECILELKDTGAITKWKFIGRRLGISDPTIESIEKKCGGDLAEAFYQMMLEWKKCKGDEATPDKLIECLEKEKLRDVADKVRKYMHQV